MTPAGRMMMQMIGSFAEFERAMLRERTRAGLESARDEGRVGSRRPKLLPQQQTREAPSCVDVFRLASTRVRQEMLSHEPSSSTVKATCAIAALREHGIAIEDEALAHLSPIGWEHVNLTGDYTWQAAGRIRKGLFRPLRPFVVSNE